MDTTPPASGGVDLGLYPDIVRAGGLAKALGELAERHGIDTGVITTHPRDRQLVDARLASARGEIYISLKPDERAFEVSFGARRHNWARGRTVDLLEAARAAEAWRHGVRLRELAERFPFMAYDDLAQAYEDGTGAEYRWRRLLDNPDLEPYRPLLRALRDNEVLGPLTASVSHRNFVRLELDAWASYGQVHVIQLPEHFHVEASWDMTPRLATTVDGAVALAAALVTGHPEAPPATVPPATDGV